MEVLSADEATKRDIPKWAQKKGHEYLGVLEEDGYFRIYLKKGVEMIDPQNAPRILIFSTEKISDPAIDLAGLLKMHYSPRAYSISVPCSSSIKPRWILNALERDLMVFLLLQTGQTVPTVIHAPPIPAILYQKPTSL